MKPEDFARGFQQAQGKVAPQPEPATPPPAVRTVSTHWTTRDDRIGSVRLAPRRGYGTVATFIWIFQNGDLVIEDVMVPRVAAGRLMGMWVSGRGEFNYVADSGRTLHARWKAFDDGRRRFSLRVFD